MKIRQGSAPAVLYRDGKKLWEFRAGRLETDEAELINLLLERGAEIETEGGERREAGGVAQEPGEARQPAIKPSGKPRRRTGL